MSPRHSTFAVALLLLASPGASAQSASGFHPTGAEFAKAYNAGDADAIVAMYADDAVLMPPGKPAMTGKAALHDFAVADTTALRQAGMTLEIDPGMSGSAGDLGWHSGAFRIKAGDGSVADTGKYVEVWERRQGRWLIIRDIWNMDAAEAPPPAAAPPAPMPAPAEPPPAEPEIEHK